MKTFVIDIETYKATRPDHALFLRQNVKPDSRLKDPEKIAADIEQKASEVVGKTTFDGAFGQIICIGVHDVDTDEYSCHYNYGGEEKERAQQFMSFIDEKCVGQASPVFVGHNMVWDWRFILKRCIVNGVRLSNQYPRTDRHGAILDTMTLWAGYKDTISLDALCVALDIESPKGEMDGSKVGAAYEAGEHDKIIQYNRRDCIAVAQIYRKMRDIGLV